MSRHHNTGNSSNKEAKKQLEQRLMEEAVAQLDEKEQHELSGCATILLFTLQYASVWLEDFIDKYRHSKLGFVVQLIAKAKAAMEACFRFIKHFEPLVSTKKEWDDDYGLFQLVLDNWFNLDTQSYSKDSDAPRAKEICKAAGLRYLDPTIKIPRTAFEDGFCKGAAYADLHPVGYMDITVNGNKKRVTFEELTKCYVEHEMKGETK